MVKLRILQIGRDKHRWVSESCDHYLKLLGRYAKVELRELPDVKHAASLPPDQLKTAQAKLILDQIDRGYLFALCDRGREYDSKEFAQQLVKQQSAGASQFTFVIGGAFGLADSVIQKADQSLSLSRLTFSHQLVRPVLLEQLYRAFSIIAGTAYHK